MSETTDRKARARTFKIVRWTVLLGVLALSTIIGIAHQKLPALRTVGVDALCPFGGVESFWKLVSTGAMISKIEAGSFVLLVGSVALALVMGRAFCGQFCPLGTLQELVGTLRDKLGIRRSEVPAWLDVPARFLKYAVLGVFTYLTWRTGLLMIRPFDPWAAYHHIFSTELLTTFGIGFAVLVASLAGSFFYDRFFCKYACPMGALLAIISKLQFFRIERHAEACIDCGRCNAACSMNVEVATAETVTSEECISCGLCVAACPKAEALTIQGRSASSPALQPMTLALGTLVVIGALIAVTTATGTMRFFKPSLAVQSAEAAPASVPAASAVPTGTLAAPGSAGASVPPPFDTSLIRGYMTLAEVCEATGISQTQIQADLGVAQADMTRPIKEIKADYGFDTDAVRRYVADKTGGSYVSPDQMTGGDACSGD